MFKVFSTNELDKLKCSKCKCTFEKTAKILLDNMEFISVDNPLRIEKVINEIKNPQRK